MPVFITAWAGCYLFVLDYILKLLSCVKWLHKSEGDKGLCVD